MKAGGEEENVRYRTEALEGEVAGVKAHCRKRAAVLPEEGKKSRKSRHIDPALFKYPFLNRRTALLLKELPPLAVDF
jgi:hypothetical protein